MAGHFIATNIRHSQIKKDRNDLRMGSKHLNSLFTVLCQEYAISIVFQRLLCKDSNSLLVINNQNRPTATTRFTNAGEFSNSQRGAFSRKHQSKCCARVRGAVQRNCSAMRF